MPGLEDAGVQALEVEIYAWHDWRNNEGFKIDWRFTTDGARIRLKRLYPANQE